MSSNSRTLAISPNVELEAGRDATVALRDADHSAAGAGSNERKYNEYGLEIIWNYDVPEPRARPPNMQFIRVHLFKIFLILAFGGIAILLLILYFIPHYAEHDTTHFGVPCNSEWWQLFEYLTIPLVSLLFTWFHVWMGIQMCFYPVEFVGCCPPVLGWQGIVPRRSEIMAGRSCDIMIGRLLKVEEIIDRIEPASFFAELSQVLEETTVSVLDKLAKLRCPGIWDQLPQSVRDELHARIMETAPEMFNPVINDVKANINSVMDVKEMAIEILVQNKALLVEMFQEIGAREFTFIQHFSAVVGFFFGFVQMLIYVLIDMGHSKSECEGDSHPFHCYAGYVVLPVSGLIGGYLTNWMGINMIFWPIHPHFTCGGYLNFQGVFLKRQKEVSYKMTKMICEHLVTARKMLEYVMSREQIFEPVKDIFRKHVIESVDINTAKVRPFVNAVAGRSVMDDLKEDVIEGIIEELPKHADHIIEYMDRQFDLVETMSYRLSHLPPDMFEGMLHPVFQEDEWMVLLLGGVLGVLVGTGQAFLLGQ